MAERSVTDRPIDAELTPALDEAELAQVWRRVRDAQAERRVAPRRWRYAIATGVAVATAAVLLVAWPRGGARPAGALADLATVEVVGTAFAVERSAVELSVTVERDASGRPVRFILRMAVTRQDDAEHTIGRGHLAQPGDHRRVNTAAQAKHKPVGPGGLRAVPQPLNEHICTFRKHKKFYSRVPSDLHASCETSQRVLETRFSIASAAGESGHICRGASV